MLMMLAAGMLLLKGLREQGCLGRDFAKVTIRDQPSSNTIQKIIAVKEAMREVEKNLQNLNVSLLKISTILLAGQPQITTEVALVLLISSAILIIVPFKYILAFFLFDLFTRELEFRREMVTKFTSLLKERWAIFPVAAALWSYYLTKAVGPGRQAKQEKSTTFENPNQVRVVVSLDNI
ncbi:chromosome-partitioning protein, putative [Actinidia rufa]|uniref:Chromosome-partitioning protein, putative n=1 Tax=Actinidia rufa TaxID=165716 RepID=A0A7J0EPW3_9ERIC|nr:chromosome-partitioning protein, putative [Actinidia rufa]